MRKGLLKRATAVALAGVMMIGGVVNAHAYMDRKINGFATLWLSTDQKTCQGFTYTQNLSTEMPAGVDGYVSVTATNNKGYKVTEWDRGALQGVTDPITVKKASRYYVDVKGSHCYYYSGTACNTCTTKIHP